MPIFTPEVTIQEDYHGINNNNSSDSDDDIPLTQRTLVTPHPSWPNLSVGGSSPRQGSNPRPGTSGEGRSQTSSTISSTGLPLHSTLIDHSTQEGNSYLTLLEKI